AVAPTTTINGLSSIAVSCLPDPVTTAATIPPQTPAAPHPPTQHAPPQITAPPPPAAATHAPAASVPALAARAAAFSLDLDGKNSTRADLTLLGGLVHEVVNPQLQVRPMELARQGRELPHTRN